MTTSKDRPGSFVGRALKWLGAAAIALVILAGTGWAFIEWRFGLPREPDGAKELLRIQSEAIPPLPPVEDAWPLYRRILTEDLGITDLGPGWSSRRTGLSQRLFDINMPAPDMSHINPLGGDWHDPALAPVRELIADAQRLLDRFDEAAARPVSRFPIVNEGDPLTGRYNPDLATPYSEMPHQLSGVMRSVQSIALWSLRDLAARDDWEGLIARSHSLIGFGNHLGMGYGGLEMFGAITEPLTLREVWLLAHENRADEATLLALIDFIESVPPARPNRAMFKERFLAITWEVAYSLTRFELTDPESWLDAWGEPRPRALARDLARLTRHAAEEIEKPRAMRKPAPVALPAGYESLNATNELLLDSWDNALMARRAALIGLHIELFERRHGRLPRTLDEALPDMALVDLGGGESLWYDPSPTDLAPYQVLQPDGYMPLFHERHKVLTNGRGPAKIPGFTPPSNSP